MKPTHGWTRLTALILTLALLLSGCGIFAGDPADTDAPATKPAQTEPAQTEPAQAGTPGQPSEEKLQEIRQRTGLLQGEVIEITDDEARQIDMVANEMLLAYAPGSGGEDSLVTPRDWSAYTSSLGEENLSPQEAEFYDRLNKVSLKYLSTSVSGVANYNMNGSVWYYSTDGVDFGDLGLSVEKATALYKWFRYNHPQYYFLSSTSRNHGSTLFPYLYENMVDGEDRAKITNELFDKLDGWIREVEDNAATTYQKVLYANNLICETVTYNDNAVKPGHTDELTLCQSLYSTVMLEDTVCAGYSMVITAMMNAMGVDATAGISYSQARRTGHAWNVVRLDNGQFYCVDTCWNDLNDPVNYPDLSYYNWFLSIGETTVNSQDKDGWHIYEDGMTAWIPAIAKDDYVPTSYDTDTKPRDKTVVKKPQVEAAEVGRNTIKFNLAGLEDRLLIRVYRDPYHELDTDLVLLDEFMIITLSEDQKDYIFAGLIPDYTYHFAFAGRNIVDGQTYDSDFTYLTVTTGTDKAAIDNVGQSLQKTMNLDIKNIRAVNQQADSVRIVWDAVTVSEAATMGYFVDVYEGFLDEPLQRYFDISDNYLDLSLEVPEWTTYCYVKARAYNDDAAVYGDSALDSFLLAEAGKYETIRNSNGVYVGETKNGKPHGFGKMTYENGDVYEGEFREGYRGGRGVYTWTNGNVYDGEWKNGRRNGHGVYTWKNGDVYAGEWKDSKRNGFGVLILANGSVIIGEWENGFQVR